jgi:glycogen debranching enzyme
VTVDPALAPRTSNEPRVPLRLFVLKHGDTFVVADAFGDIIGVGDGLFHDDTRILSSLRLSMGGRPLVLLGGAVGQDNVLFTANLTNRPLAPIGGPSAPEGIIHVERTRLLWEARLHERVRLTNYGPIAARVALALSFAADFRDLFEVRGARRSGRGQDLPPVVAADAVTLRYQGLDDVLRTASLAFCPAPARLSGRAAEFELALAAGSRTDLYVEAGLAAAEQPSRARFRAASARARHLARSSRRRGATLWSSSRLFNEWLGKSRADLALLTTEFATGPYPYAGIPWFSTAFGRDAIVTALQTLWLDPTLARGVLGFLAEHR